MSVLSSTVSLATDPKRPKVEAKEVKEVKLGRPPTEEDLKTVYAGWRPFIGDILWSAEEIRVRVQELGAQISAVYTSDDDILCIAILKGAVIFAADLLRHCAFKHELDFLNCSSYGSSTESSGQVELLSPLRIPVKGRHVLLIEDLIDSGLTLDFARKHVLGGGAASLRIAVLFNKRGRRLPTLDITPDFCGFECPNKFIVGYGMDFAQHYRTLPFVSVLKPEAYKKKIADPTPTSTPSFASA